MNIDRHDICIGVLLGAFWRQQTTCPLVNLMHACMMSMSARLCAPRAPYFQTVVAVPTKDLKCGKYVYIEQHYAKAYDEHACDVSNVY